MELNGDILIAAPRDRVWRALNDPEVLARSIPGCEEVRQISGDETHVRLALRLGPVRARFVGKIRMSDVRIDEGCALDFEGSGGAAGFAKGRSTVSLASEGAGTRLRYSAQASVGGKLGQIGGRMIDATAKQTADRFFLAFGQQLGAVAPGVASDIAVHAEASAAPMPAGAARPAAPQAAPARGEAVRVLWFVLGSLATGFGFWIASAIRAAGH